MLSRLAIVCFLFSYCGLSFSRDVTFTLEVKSGTKECFYEYINEGAFLEVEYQVSTFSECVGLIYLIVVYTYSAGHTDKAKIGDTSVYSKVSFSSSELGVR